MQEDGSNNGEASDVGEDAATATPGAGGDIERKRAFEKVSPRGAPAAGGGRKLWLWGGMAEDVREKAHKEAEWGEQGR